jgi:ribosomal protein L16 Arg81 hydroxylase
MTDMETGLPWLLNPVTVATFKRTYWERHPLVIKRKNPKYFSSLPTLLDMEELLRGYESMSEFLRLVKNGEEVPLSDVGTGIEKPMVAFRSGATIVLHGLQRMHLELARLCNALSNDASCDFRANAYLTPGSMSKSQGLGVHYDTHDVFIIQLSGSKLWSIYQSPIHLPLESHRQDPLARDKGHLIEECELEPGDCIYIPHGFYHSAKVCRNRLASLHLTIGIYPTTWSDLITIALRRASEREILLRESLPLGFARDEYTLPKIKRRFRRMLSILSRSVHIESALRTTVSELIDQQRPLLSGHLSDLEACKALRMDTRVRRRPEINATTSITGREIDLRFHAKVVQMPLRLSRALNFILRADSFSPCDIPGKLKDSEKRVLVTRLIEEGYLTIIEEGIQATKFLETTGGRRNARTTSRYSQRRGR